ncbi:MAG: PAS domain-containing sensor histidine kinase [Dehalococcoidia bacterium]|nr:PAS domain-containing sensor histidine kinase [Dehalococcoidia bacterium]
MGIGRISLKPRWGRWIARYPLSAYSPRLKNWRFWAIQAQIIAIFCLHTVVEVKESSLPFHMPYAVPISLYLVPVIFSAVHFGFVGSMATVFGISILNIFNIAFLHSGAERWGEVSQLVVIIAVAFFLGRRVEMQRIAWKQTEATKFALKASEIKYRSLFDLSPVAAILLNNNGIVLDANPAAGFLFERPPEFLRGMQSGKLLGDKTAEKLIRASNDGKTPRLLVSRKMENGSVVRLKPILTPVFDSQGTLSIQILLQDITEESTSQEGLRAYTAYILIAQEQERQKISRELHDETIQQLSLICHQLDSIQNSGPPLDPPKIAGLKAARQTAEKAVNWLRDFSRSLRPPVLDDLGVTPAIRRLALDIEDRIGAKSHFKTNGKEKRLPQDIELWLFRLAQEGLRNVERHSKAADLWVTLGFKEHEVTLEIRDNGIGFSVSDDFAVDGHLGLIGMNERTQMLNGKLEIQSNPWTGSGTRIIITIPV